MILFIYNKICRFFKYNCSKYPVLDSVTLHSVTIILCQNAEAENSAFLSLIFFWTMETMKYRGVIIEVVVYAKSIGE